MCTLQAVQSGEEQRKFFELMEKCKIECLPAFVRIINVKNSALQFHRLILDEYENTVGFISYVFVHSGNIADCYVVGAYVFEQYRNQGFFKGALTLLEEYGSPIVLLLDGLPSRKWLQLSSVNKYRIV